MSVNSILGQAEAAGNGSAVDKIAEDKNMFLKLLVAQLTHQDPLNPVEDKEFIAQLAQFTSVEKLQSINDGIQEMTDAYDRSQLTSAAALMNRRVMANGYSISKGSNADGSTWTTPVLYTAPEDLASCVISVLNPSTGRIVYSAEMGARMAETYQFTWDGVDSAGLPVADGVYEISVIATNANGQRVLVDTEVFGDVLMVEQENGEYYLRLSDNRRIKFTDVNTIGFIPANSGDQTATGGDGSG